MSAWSDLFAEVARTRYSSLVAYGILLTADRARAQDLVQDAFVKVFSRVRTLPNAAAADQYIRRTMLTLYIDEARRGTVASTSRGIVAQPESQPGHADAVADGSDVRSALTRLTPQERAAVVLRYFDDLTVPQVAERLDLAEGTVKRYLADARTKLGAELSPGHGVERVPVVPPEGATHA